MVRKSLAILLIDGGCLRKIFKNDEVSDAEGSQFEHILMLLESTIGCAFISKFYYQMEVHKSGTSVILDAFNVITVTSSGSYQRNLDNAISTKVIECAFGLNGEVEHDKIVILSENSFSATIECVAKKGVEANILSTKSSALDNHRQLLRNELNEVVYLDDLVSKSIEWVGENANKKRKVTINPKVPPQGISTDLIVSTQAAHDTDETVQHISSTNSVTAVSSPNNQSQVNNSIPQSYSLSMKPPLPPGPPPRPALTHQRPPVPLGPPPPPPLQSLPIALVLLSSVKADVIQAKSVSETPSAAEEKEASQLRVQTGTIKFLRKQRSAQKESEPVNLFDSPEWIELRRATEGLSLTVTGAGVDAANGTYHFAGLMNRAGFFERAHDKGRFAVYRWLVSKNQTHTWFLSFVSESDAKPGSCRDVNLYYSIPSGTSVLPLSRWHCMTADLRTDTHINVTVNAANYVKGLSVGAADVDTTFVPATHPKEVLSEDSAEKAPATQSAERVEPAISILVDVIQVESHSSAAELVSGDGDDNGVAAVEIATSPDTQQEDFVPTSGDSEEVGRLAEAFRTLLEDMFPSSTDHLSILSEIASQFAEISTELKVNMSTALRASRLVLDCLQKLHHFQIEAVAKSVDTATHRSSPCVVQEEDSYDVSCRNILCGTFHAVSEKDVTRVLYESLGLIEQLGSGLRDGYCVVPMYLFCDLVHSVHAQLEVSEDSSPIDIFVDECVRLFSYLFPSLAASPLLEAPHFADIAHKMHCVADEEVSLAACWAMLDCLRTLGERDLLLHKEGCTSPRRAATKSPEGTSALHRCELIVMNVFPYLTRVEVERSLFELLRATSQLGVAAEFRDVPMKEFCEVLWSCYSVLSKLS